MAICIALWRGMFRKGVIDHDLQEVHCGCPARKAVLSSCDENTGALKGRRMPLKACIKMGMNNIPVRVGSRQQKWQHYQLLTYRSMMSSPR
eukprot:1915100-Amphidinium_carterae.1